MQLPRGTFREIRKGIQIGSLVAELIGEKYTGIASISSPDASGTLVFRQGKFLLVKFRNARGDAALDEIQNAGRQVVDAALSLLGDTQIELALEFNKPCRLTRSGKNISTQATFRPGTPEYPGVPRPPSSGPAVKPKSLHPPLPAHSPISPARAADTSRRAPSPHPVTTEVPPAPAGKPAEAETTFEDDLTTFENLDIDSVTDKIRNDCKSMIKQLHLDHLMEK